ncbi:DUF1738 domain-containing protein [Mucilaginibacter limnophilus]|uniref:DUF1738 domain-containing protein n=1 Tax=Mucilaginibacter limnophilus TaxID=1932778 RepID=A0A437MPZ2_9SPHI|nr:zincin-like metallopeptidase domain-containing protein [Mucilaginibacter limnophilus]RVT99712.1 DUF1738 domain-containing protein [Mucilaginibacter limnophilus]
MNNKALHEQIAEKLIDALEKGTSPFQHPWTDDHTAGFITPVNPTTGNNYRGMNALWLAMQGRSDPRWLTLNQASRANWSVEKGAKAVLINFVKTNELQPVLNTSGEKQLDENGRVKMHSVKLDKPVITKAWVFNGEQIRGIPDWRQVYQQAQAEQIWSPIDRAELIIKQSNAELRHGGNEAFYSPRYDFIAVPQKEQFDSAAKYYATVLHELGHWTGHKSRLDRPLGGGFGSEAYAKEELRAEISSLMVGSALNIGHDFGQHAAYVDSWIRILRHDPLELHKASTDAQKITDYLLTFERKLEQQQSASLPVSKYLEKGEVIGYKDTRYEVLNVHKNRTAEVQDLNTGQKIKVGVKNGLYASLLDARIKPADIDRKNDQPVREVAPDNQLQR